jgi:hypothetical protein
MNLKTIPDKADRMDAYARRQALRKPRQTLTQRPRVRVILDGVCVGYPFLANLFSAR